MGGGRIDYIRGWGMDWLTKPLICSFLDENLKRRAFFLRFFPFLFPLGLILVLLWGL